MRIIIQPIAEKQLDKLPKNIVGEMLKKLYSIRENPLRYIERLKGHRLWKLRIGDYRVILFINTGEETINVIKIGHRKNIYREL